MSESHQVTEAEYNIAIHRLNMGGDDTEDRNLVDAWRRAQRESKQQAVLDRLNTPVSNSDTVLVLKYPFVKS